MKILSSTGVVLIVPGFQFPPPGLPKTAKPFLPDSAVARVIVSPLYVVDVRWHLADGHQYAYLGYQGTQSDCNEIAQSIQLGTHAFGSPLSGGEAYNYTYRSQTYDKIKDPP